MRSGGRSRPELPDIAFLFPPGGFVRSFFHHLGVAYIQSHLARRGYGSRQIVPPAGSTLQEYASLALEAGAPIIGFSCYDTNAALVRSLASQIRETRPDITLIAGGPTASFADEKLLEHIPALDVVVRFEGEESTGDLLDRLRDGAEIGDLGDLDGITFRRGRDIVRTPDRPLSFTPGGSGLDRFPSPYLDGTLTGREGAGLLTSRGCAYHCTYCTFSALAKHTVRFHSVDRILGELGVVEKALRGSGASTAIPLNDDAFGLHPRRAKEICKAIVDAGLEVRLSCMCRADRVDEELLWWMKQAGFSDLCLGVESASPQVLRNIKKVCARPCGREEAFEPERRFLSRVREVVELAKRNGIEPSVSVILGLPGEGPEAGRRTLEFVQSLRVAQYSHNLLVTSRGTEIFETAAEFGIGTRYSVARLCDETRHAYDARAVPDLDNSSIAREERIDVKALLRLLGGVGSGTGPSGGIGLALAKLDRPDNATPLADWCTRSLALDAPRILVDLSSIRDQAEEEVARARLTRDLLPTHDARVLHVDRGGRGTVLSLAARGGSGRRYRFPFARVAKLSGLIDGAGRDPGTWPIIELGGPADFKVLSAVVSALQASTGAGASSESRRPVVLPRSVFLDGCRWCPVPCPGTDLDKAVWDGGRVRPCLTGASLGAGSVALDELRARARDEYDKAGRARGCASCSARDRCARCLFPAPMGVEDYCEAVRSFPEVGELVHWTNLRTVVHEP